MGNMSPIVAELERLYIEVVERWFRPWLGDNGADVLLAEPPMMTVASRGRKATVTGWYVPAVWKDTGEDILAALAGEGDAPVALKRAEVVIASELLSKPTLVVAEVARQTMAHAKRNMRVGENLYYPQVWEQNAPEVGCTATINPKQPGKGWSLWKPEPEFREWSIGVIDLSVFDVKRIGLKARQAPGSRMKKWRCGCTTIRCATEVVGVCAKCGQKWEWAEVRETEPDIWAHGRLAAVTDRLNAALRAMKGVRN